MSRSPADRSPSSIGRGFIALCFAALLVLGGTLYRDYGFSFDEDGQRENGVMTVKYVIEQVAPALARPVMNKLARSDEYLEISVPLDRYSDRDYGVAFDAPAVALEALFGLTDSRDIFLFRHLLTFVVCLGGAYAVYSLAHRRYGDRWMGLLGVAFLVLSPRLFADSFYNAKDAVFMAAFAMALNTAVAFVLRPGPRNAVLHALATAFAIDVRIAGIVLPVVTVGLVIVRILKREGAVGRTLAFLGIHLAAMAALVVALWPLLWSNPLGHFAEALATMSRFRFDRELLYLGDYVRSTELPWHYIPVWLSITTPPLYLLLFVAGAITTGWQLITSGRGFWKDEGELQDLIFLGMCVAPVGAVIMLHSVLYDGWRQLYFIYPAFLLVCLTGWFALWSGAKAARLGRPALVAVAAIAVVSTAAWMWRVHPLQNVYFNVLAGTNLKTRFELDYWGLGTRRALEHVLAHDSRDSIVVGAMGWVPVAGNIMLLAPQDRRRLRVAENIEAADYLLANSDRATRAVSSDRYDLFHEHRIDNEVIFSIFKRKS